MKREGILNQKFANLFRHLSLGVRGGIWGQGVLLGLTTDWSGLFKALNPRVRCAFGNGFGTYLFLNGTK